MCRLVCESFLRNLSWPSPGWRASECGGIAGQRHPATGDGGQAVSSVAAKMDNARS